MKKIKQAFDKRFRRWDIRLPQVALQEQKRGSIQKNGWTINYRFDCEHDIEFLEYFASHRMTNDTLNRIYEDGRTELVAACQEFFLVDDPNGEQAMMENNRQFYDRVGLVGLDRVAEQSEDEKG